MPPAITQKTLLPRQTRFVMPIADDVRLVSVETARAVRGVTAEDIFEMVEDHKSPHYLPAFDFNIYDGKKRSLRIWAGALRDSSITNRETIIADCLLTNVVGLQNEFFNLNNSQIERAWCMSNQTLLEFINQKLVVGIRVGRNWRINRYSAAQFLKGRML